MGREVSGLVGAEGDIFDAQTWLQLEFKAPATRSHEDIHSLPTFSNALIATHLTAV